MKLKSIIPTLSLMAAMPAMGAITLVASQGDLVTGAASSQTVSFDANAGTKLIVTVTGEARGNNGNPASSVSSITFGGVALTSAISHADSGSTIQLGALYYLDNPGTGALDLVVTWDGDTNGAAISALSVTDAATGAPEVTAVSQSTSVGITSLSSNALLVAATVTNAGGGAIAPTADAPLIQTVSGDSGSSLSSAGYQILGAAGAQTPSFSGGRVDASGRPIAFAATFAEVPEPSTALLGSLGVIALLRRRR